MAFLFDFFCLLQQEFCLMRTSKLAHGVIFSLADCSKFMVGVCVLVVVFSVRPDIGPFSASV